MILNKKSRHLWLAFLNNDDNLGHVSRALHGNDLDDHVRACWRSAQETAEKLKGDIEPLQPKNILEVGASTGINCFALKKLYQNAQIWGLEPETHAVKLAQSMKAAEEKMPIFIEGVGESIPLPDASVDLILCHTVIEHVRDVPKVISEMNRVLAPGGVIHLEAPNYVWPYEPHLGIWCIPLLGKRCIRFFAHIQGKGKEVSFLDHLQLVHPGYLENVFDKYALEYKNRSIEKIESVFLEKADIKRYKLLASILIMIKRLRLDRIVLSLLEKYRIYPSVLYTIRKSDL